MAVDTVEPFDGIVSLSPNEYVYVTVPYKSLCFCTTHYKAIITHG